MRPMPLIAGSVVLLLAMVAAVAPAAAQEDTDALVRVEESGLGARVVDRELEDERDTFAEGERVYFFTKVGGAEPGSKILHVWYQGEDERATIELSVGASTWRTWSYKTMHPGSKGPWRVEAVDASGRVLESMTFTCE